MIVNDTMYWSEVTGWTHNRQEATVYTEERMSNKIKYGKMPDGDSVKWICT